MNLFLDTSVILAACGSQNGASRFVFDAAAANDWRLLTSEYVLQEVAINLPLFPEDAATQWTHLRGNLEEVPDIVTFEWATVFTPAKDRPILFTAAAWGDVLLTLDRRDFVDMIGGSFYGLGIMKPGDFLKWERSTGTIKDF